MSEKIVSPAIVDADVGPVAAGRGEATWRGAEPPEMRRPQGVAGWWRVIRRGVPAVLVLLIGVLLILPMRGIERLFHGPRRPWTGPHVQIVCRLALLCMGIGWRREGVPMSGAGAVVANHSSWLDILTMNAAMPVFFVSKAEVRTWPGINILTRVTDTHFVVRDPKLARAQAEEFAARVRAGHRLLFFPEGTSTDGRRVLPFKPTLFQGFLDPALPKGLVVQPLTASYQAPEGEDPRFYGWWADMDLGPHLLTVLSVKHPGRVVIRLHAPIMVEGQTRKTLAAQCEAAVRAGLLSDESL
ncbi:1-acyl-sn-glycerol-3-phosphate acyltransferase [Paracoccus caeni]|uniref:1-acyl-sn-glycerol-3-phosphate acyltransferase n=1 Tax=Paracoccus caeni TaxID=657651 RepID=A0A934SIH7_9RHOB|nr:lysophospholipid acyltransferase family protein [Paracoccus caeni]MBK4215068.1 1-acyl-sn-glycerol-3-phosphate acyltransferase [Paracoccus caeni]